MKPLSLTEKKEFYNAFGSLYNAGFSYTDALDSIASASYRKRVKVLCLQLKAYLESNIPFKTTIGKFKEILGEAYAALLCAGDFSGKLDKCINVILKDIQRVENIRNTLISTLTYPTLLVLGAIGVLLLCKFFFFKVFDVMYTTGMAQCAIMNLFISAIIKIIAIYAAIFIFIIWSVVNKEVFAKALDFVTTYTFLAGIVNNYYYYNFFSVLAAAYEAGIPIKDSMNLASTVLKTQKAKRGINRACAIISQGVEVKTAFVGADIFSQFALSQIAAGEKSGKLGEAFQRIADDYERKLQNTIAAISSLIQPVSIVLVGILVGYIAVTFYTKLYAGILNL